MIVEHRENEDRFDIDTGRYDPIMIVGLLQARNREMYDIIVEDNKVIVKSVPYIELIT